LLEILVALTLLGMLFLSLAQGSGLALSAFDRQSRQTERRVDLDSIHRTLRRLLQNARPGSQWESLEFVGTAQSVLFTTTLPIPNAAAPTTRADVELAVDAAHRLTLTWRQRIHAVSFGAPPLPVHTMLLPGVARLDMGYWPAKEGGWTSEWRDANPPRLVRVRIIADATDGVRWPDLLAAPMLDPP
jgi:hypothetical protein